LGVRKFGRSSWCRHRKWEAAARARSPKTEVDEVGDDADAAAKDLLRKRIQETFHQFLITVARRASKPHQDWFSGERAEQERNGRKWPFWLCKLEVAGSIPARSIPESRSTE